MKNIILGINCGHDATAVLLKDGAVAAGVAEERLTRNKLQIGFPWLAIQEALRLSGVRPAEVDAVVVPHEQYLRANPFFINLIMDNHRPMPDIGNELSLSSLLVETFYQLRNRRKVTLSLSRTVKDTYARDAFRQSLDACGIKAPVMTKDHHMAHAASAYYTSGYDTCLIMTADGSGDGLSHTTCIGRGGGVVRRHVTPRLYSPGVFYSAVTKFLGFKRHKHEGKITGLAAYGDPERLYTHMTKILCLDRDRTSFYSGMDYDFSSWDKMRWQARLLKNSYFRSLETNYLLDVFARLFRDERAEDIAAAAQRCLEDTMLALVAEAVKETGQQRIALAGGIFANVKVNQRILEIPGVKEVFIHPNMGDGGTALGGACLCWADELKDRGERLAPERIRDVYWGPGFTDKEIQEVLSDFGLEAAYYPNGVERRIGELLAQGHVIGRFNGRMEYGPRALGNRSILSQATDPSIKDWLNARLKRTEFMPFAPSILAGSAADYYEGMPQSAFASEFMTIACTVKAAKRHLAPGVHHVDATARPHIVKKDVNPSYHAVLEAYRERSGLPLLLNTSFNTHEHPIVCTPRDAVENFLRGGVDILAIGNHIVFSDQAKRTQEKRQARS